MPHEWFKDWLKDQIFKKDKFFKRGHYAQVIAVLLVVFDYWKLIDLDKVPFAYIPHLRDGAYLFIGLTASAASVFVYLEKKNRIAINKFCPECGTELEISHNYKCPTCGDLTFSKKILNRT